MLKLDIPIKSTVSTSGVSSRDAFPAKIQLDAISPFAAFTSSVAVVAFSFFLRNFATWNAKSAFLLRNLPSQIPRPDVNTSSGYTEQRDRGNRFFGAAIAPVFDCIGQTVMQCGIRSRGRRGGTACVSINFTTYPILSLSPFCLSLSPVSLILLVLLLLSAPPTSYTTASCARLYYKLNRRVLRSSNKISTPARLETRHRG